MGGWKNVARWVWLPFFVVACTSTGPPETAEIPSPPLSAESVSSSDYVDPSVVSPFETRLLSLEERRDHLGAVKGLKALENSFVQDIAVQTASIRRIQKQIDEAETFLAQMSAPDRTREETVPVSELPRTIIEPTEWFQPEGLAPGPDQVLMAKITMKNGDEQILRYVRESESSILVGLPSGVITMPRSTISTIEPFLLEADEYHFALGDYYDNVPTSRNFYQAIHHYRMALDINPEHAGAKENLSKCEEELPKILGWEKSRAEAGAKQRAQELREMEMQALAENQARARWESQQRSREMAYLQNRVRNLQSEVNRLQAYQYHPYYGPIYPYYFPIYPSFHFFRTPFRHGRLLSRTRLEFRGGLGAAQACDQEVFRRKKKGILRKG